MATHPGVLLCKTHAQGFEALDVDGQTVYGAAASLRELVRSKLGDEAAQHFALPQGEGERFAWYASIPGTVTPWAQASDAQRASVLAQLEVLRTQVSAVARNLENAAEAETQAQGRLLRKALNFPGSDHVYLVAGRPVVAFWGFAVPGSENLDPLRYLRIMPVSFAAVASEAQAEVASTPAPAPVPEAAPSALSPLRWLGWLLLLFFLLLALFLGLRTFKPEMELPWGLSDITLPWMTAEEDAAAVQEEPEPAVEEEEPEPVVEEPEPEPEPEAEEEPEPVVEEPEPEPIQLSIDMLNGRWVGVETLASDRATGETKNTGHLEYVLRDGAGTVRQIGLDKKTVVARSNVTVSLRDVEFSDPDKDNKQVANVLKISKATLRYPVQLRRNDLSIPEFECVPGGPDDFLCFSGATYEALSENPDLFNSDKVVQQALNRHKN